jgi:AmmeMemoRadiSam system protein A
MSQQPENPPPAPSPTISEPNKSCGEFSAEERKILVAFAHESLAAYFEHRELSFEPPTPHLAQQRGVFTTLYLQGQLRGCVGYIFPVASVYQTVAETARAAAFEDTRFFPVTEKELPQLTVHLSILSELRPIEAHAVEVGRHGLLVSWGGRRGLLLPQVAVENKWDRVTFLEQTCRKAGLPLDAWKKGATLECFTAELFGDSDLD